MVVGISAGIRAGGAGAGISAAAIRQRDHYFLDLHHGLQLPARPRGLHIVRTAGLSGRGRLRDRVLPVLLRQQSLRRHFDRHTGGHSGVVRHRPAVRAVARRLLRLGQSRAGGDHLLSDAEGAGRHHARRQRPVVPHQHDVDAAARPDAARSVLHLRLPGRLRRLGLLQISRRLDLRRLLPGDQDQRGQGEIPWLQQLQHPAVRLCHRQHDHRAGRGVVCRLSRLRQPGDHQPGARRRPGGGDYTRRRRHAVRTARRLDRLYRHERRAQQGARQLGAGDRLRARVHHARRRKGYLGLAGTADQKNIPARDRQNGRPGRKQPMIDMQLLISGVIFGLSLGGIFFLMTIGLSLCFGLMRIISLDQLLYYSIGAYITYSVSLAVGNIWLGVLGGVVVGGLAALAVERIVFRRIYDRDLPFTMITSFGVLIGGVGVIKFFWGLVPRPVPVPIDVQVYIIGTEIPVYRLVIIGIAGLVYVGIWLFLNRTIIGKAIRAGTEDVAHVEGLGINVYRLFTITFVIAGGLSGLAGGLHAPLIMVDPNMGLEVLAFVFMVVIIGGLGSIKGTLVSSFLVGQVVSIGSLIYAPLAQMAPFAIMLLILLVRPTGLFGSQMLKR